MLLVLTLTNLCHSQKVFSAAHYTWTVMMFGSEAPKNYVKCYSFSHHKEAESIVDSHCLCISQQGCTGAPLWYLYLECDQTIIFTGSFSMLFTWHSCTGSAQWLAARTHAARRGTYDHMLPNVCSAANIFSTRNHIF